MTKALLITVLAMLLGIGAMDMRAQCVVMPNNECSTTFGNPACTFASGKTCIHDAIRCRTSCGTGGWQDCDVDPSSCIDYQW